MPRKTSKDIDSKKEKKCKNDVPDAPDNATSDSESKKKCRIEHEESSTKNEQYDEEVASDVDDGSDADSGPNVDVKSEEAEDDTRINKESEEESQSSDDVKKKYDKNEHYMQKVLNPRVAPMMRGSSYPNEERKYQREERKYQPRGKTYKKDDTVHKKNITVLNFSYSDAISTYGSKKVDECDIESLLKYIIATTYSSGQHALSLVLKNTLTGMKNETTLPNITLDWSNRRQNSNRSTKPPYRKNQDHSDRYK